MSAVSGDTTAIHVCVEGVFLENTILSTNDIRTIRGASVYLEELHLYLMQALTDHAPALLSSGASRAHLSCSGDLEAIRDKVAEFCRTDWRRHLVFRFGVGPTPDDARSQLRRSLYKDWTVPVPEPVRAPRLDALDPCRPATQVLRGPDGQQIHVSARTAELRRKGAELRPFFPLPPPLSFEDIVADPPDGLDMVVKNKIAVVYVDGSGFGAASKAMGAAAFSKALALNNTSLGARLAEWVTNMNAWWGQHQGRSRFEILMWGGDDMTFIMPAWMLFPFVKVFFKEVDAWRFGDDRVSFRCGAIIANFKVPIRLLRSLAYDAQESVRNGCFEGSKFSVDVFESAAPPYGSVGAYRRALYGPNHVEGADAMPASAVDDMREAARTLVVDEPDGEHLTHRQIHALLWMLRSSGRHVSDPGADSFLVDKANRYSSRMVGGEIGDLDEWRKAFGGERSLALALAQMAQLLPYLKAADLVEDIV